ncbi:MAG: hypothetical protein EXQ74_06695 [Thermoleophilia bacterium]|nr:hypothetical protein [Thermoleophilia bacterium]
MSPSEPRAQWTHVLASVLALTSADHRVALMRDFLDEDLPDIGNAIVREFAPAGDDVIDIVVQDRDKAWALGIQTTLAFQSDTQARLSRAAGALEGYGRVIVMAITADRTSGPAISGACSEGIDARHSSWLRVRDWIQERPERGRAHGVDFAVLQQAEYLLTPNVAELYRLEDIVPIVPVEAREAVTAAFFGLNDLSPAPRIDQHSDGATAVFPRTGDPCVELVIRGGSASVVLNADGGPGMTTTDRPGWGALAIGSDADWDLASSWGLAAARRLLPRKR